MRSFRAVRKCSGIEISYVAVINEEDALKRKQELEMSIENYNYQLQKVRELKELAEKELEELKLVLGDKSIASE